MGKNIKPAYPHSTNEQLNFVSPTHISFRIDKNINKGNANSGVGRKTLNKESCISAH